MAVCVRIKKVSVHVYESCSSSSGGGGGRRGGGSGSGAFERISAFETDTKKPGASAVCVVYSARVHYDALEA